MPPADQYYPSPAAPYPGQPLGYGAAPQMAAPAPYPGQYAGAQAGGITPAAAAPASGGVR